MSETEPDFPSDPGAWDSALVSMSLAEADGLLQGKSSGARAL